MRGNDSGGTVGGRDKTTTGKGPVFVTVGGVATIAGTGTVEDEGLGIDECLGINGFGRSH